MYKGKQILGLILSVAMIGSLFQTSAFAGDLNNNQGSQVKSITMLETNEPSMPAVKNVNMYTLNNEVNTLDAPLRQEWCEKTEKVLEKTYGQEISSVSETEDFIVFEFQTDKDADITDEHVLMVKYVKPESTLATEDYNTKFTYTWGWKSKYYSYDEKSGKWSRLQKLSIAVITSAEKTVLEFLSNLYSIVSSTIDSDVEVDVASLYKSYFLNETCAVKEPTYATWLPYVNVGCRKDFMAGRCVVYDKYGQPNMTYPEKQEKEGKPSKNPTNFDRSKESTHFDNFTWMKNKAIQLYKLNGVAHNEVLGYPDNYHITDAKP